MHAFCLILSFLFRGTGRTPPPCLVPSRGYCQFLLSTLHYPWCLHRLLASRSFPPSCLPLSAFLLSPSFSLRISLFFVTAPPLFGPPLSPAVPPARLVCGPQVSGTRTSCLPCPFTPPCSLFLSRLFTSSRSFALSVFPLSLGGPVPLVWSFRLPSRVSCCASRGSSYSVCCPPLRPHLFFPFCCACQAFREFSSFVYVWPSIPSYSSVVLSELYVWVDIYLPAGRPFSSSLQGVFPWAVSALCFSGCWFLSAASRASYGSCPFLVP